MNILLVTQHFGIAGGSDVIVHQTKRLLEAEGHTVHIFAARTGSEADDGVYPSGAHFERPHPLTLWKFLYSPEARNRLDAFLDRHPVDVAHLHIYYGTVTSSILAPLVRRGIDVVHHLHEYRSFCSVYTAERAGKPCVECRVGKYWPGLKHRCNRGSLLRSAMSTAEMYMADRLGAKRVPFRFLTVSQFQRDLLVGQGLPADSVKTLYNPVDSMFFAVDPGPDAAREGVLFVGRIEHYKGVFDLLDAAAALPDIPFTIIGDGKALSDLRERIAQQGLRNVTTTGQLDRTAILPHLARHRVMLVPSRWNETFGLTAVEAMAARMPIIVTRMGGLPEIVEDGVSGFVVEMGDVAQMITHLAQIHSEAALGRRMGNAAQERARKVFSEANYTRRLMSHLQAA